MDPSQPFLGVVVESPGLPQPFESPTKKSARQVKFNNRDSLCGDQEEIISENSLQFQGSLSRIANSAGEFSLLINEIGPSGFILSSGCDIPFNAKPENVKAMISAATGK